MSGTPTASTADLPVVVIGAGPVGLAAAAHLLERGLEPLVLEAGRHPGAAVHAWGHVRLFSPWEYDVDAAAVRLLERAGWDSPAADELPTGADLVSQYLAPLAATPELTPRVRTSTRVVAVARAGADTARGRDDRPLVVRTLVDGRLHDLPARAVVDASGTWGQPAPFGAAGLPAIGVEAARPWLVGPLPDVLGRDRARLAGRHTLVVGTGHSAANTLLALVGLREQEPGTRITWAIRGRSPARLYGGGDTDGLPARGLLGSTLRAAVRAGSVTLLREVSITRLAPAADGRLEVAGTGRDGAPVELRVDALAAATGFRPDLSVLREVHLDLDPALEAPSRLAPLIDPALHSCGTVPPHGHRELTHPDPGVFVVGMKSYGRAPTFLLATGYEQVRSIAAALAGDGAAADDVRLHLPSTGVCSTDLGTREDTEAREAGTDGTEGADGAAAGACCGSASQPATAGVGAG